MRVDFNLSCKQTHELCGRSKGAFVVVVVVVVPPISLGQTVDWRDLLAAKEHNQHRVRLIMLHLRVPSNLNGSLVVQIIQIGPRFDQAYR